MAKEPVADALHRARNEPDQFERFYDEYAEELLTFVARRVYDVDTAVDLMAEVFARALLKCRSFRGKTDAEARGWLYSIATHEIADYFRRSKVEHRAVQRLAMQVRRPSEEDHERIIELAGLRELRGAVRQELGHLSSEQEQAVRLRIIDELPYEEIAEALGISQQAARARVARGLKSLATVLEKYRPTLKEGLA